MVASHPPRYHSDCRSTPYAIEVVAGLTPPRDPIAAGDDALDHVLKQRLLPGRIERLAAVGTLAPVEASVVGAGGHVGVGAGARPARHVVAHDRLGTFHLRRALRVRCNNSKNGKNNLISC